MGLNDRAFLLCSSRKQLHISSALVFAASQHKLTVVCLERRLDFVAFLYVLNRSLEDNKCANIYVV